MSNKPLTERDYEVLYALYGERGARPLDIGGSNGSHHNATLTKLIKRGLVTRWLRSPCGGLFVGRGSYRYKLTDAGTCFVNEHRAAEDVERAQLHVESIQALGLPSDTTPKQLRQVKQGVLVWRDGVWEMPPHDGSAL